MKKTLILIAALFVCAQSFAQKQQSRSARPVTKTIETKVSKEDTFAFSKVFSLINTKGSPNTKVQFNNGKKGFMYKYKNMTLYTLPDPKDPNLDAITLYENAGYVVNIYRDWTFEPAFVTQHDQLTAADLEKVSSLCKQLQSLN